MPWSDGQGHFGPSPHCANESPAPWIRWATPELSDSRCEWARHGLSGSTGCSSPIGLVPQHGASPAPPLQQRRLASARCFAGSRSPFALWLWTTRVATTGSADGEGGRGEEAAVIDSSLRQRSSD